MIYLRLSAASAALAKQALWERQIEAGLPLAAIVECRVGSDTVLSTPDGATEALLFQVLDAARLPYTRSATAPLSTGWEPRHEF